MVVAAEDGAVVAVRLGVTQPGGVGEGEVSVGLPDRDREPGRCLVAAEEVLRDVGEVPAPRHLVERHRHPRDDHDPDR